MKTILTALLLSWLPILLLASDNATHAGPVEIPFDEIGPQIFNFLVFFSLLVFFLRKPTVKMFSDRASNYKAALTKADQALAEAKVRRSEMETKINELTKNHQESLNTARKEAEQIGHNAIADAKTEAARIKEEAQRTVQVELEKAKTDLRNFLLHQAVSMADKDLGNQLDVNEQKRLQQEFAGKIQVVP